jgi:hypothetical protein
MSESLSSRVGFLTFEQIRSEVGLGSSRIRARWLINHWQEAELFTIGKKYDAIIFQKAYWTDYARSFPGIKILDLCDPDFLDWRSQCIPMANMCHAVVTPTASLADAISRYTRTPITVIPDRIDFRLLGDIKKTHEGGGPARTAVWYGYSENFASLDASIEDVISLNIQRLIVIASPRKPYQLSSRLERYLTLINCEWDEELAPRILALADVVINYRLSDGRWVYKSNNKSIFAWALGVPVAHSAEELMRLIPEEARVKESQEKYQLVKSLYDVRRSVQEYKQLLDSILQHGNINCDQ